ncbi:MULTISPECIES: YmaF family protein [Bacillus]|uniref:YmaF family protein n=2 Tax=Bacillus TaxID=1386 RepID=A0A0M4G7R9_9BACI|nr:MULTISPECIES: YmaF family protein [Bacillus]ALC81133.1 hypothetical protein AM592_05625 [Bacillus gobiensis]MBP1080100.1 hypothetical protein [Bacillus capparidis]MED1095486.1 YmaF family protein [Bacillus capparidis]
MPLYQSDWERKPSHVHAYRIITSKEIGHYHLIEGFSQPSNGSNYDKHTHFFAGVVSFENGHYHRYYGISGPAIPSVDGTHYHLLSGSTYLAYNEPVDIPHGGVVYQEGEKERHRHSYRGKTFEIVGNEPLNW